MSVNLTISQRKREILLQGIEQFISSGEPIVSGRLEKLGLSYSSATIRNELAELEEQGFLRQLHTSGGRVPTEKGYVAYVSGLAGKIPMDSEIRLEKIESGFMQKTGYLSTLIDTVAKAISKASNLPSAIMLDGFDNIKIKSIKIVPLISDQCFVLIETELGIIDPVFIDIKNASEGLCQDASAALTNSFRGQTIKTLIEGIEKVGAEITKDITGFKEIFVAVVDLLKQSIERYKNIVSSGTSSLLSVKEFKESEKAKALIDFIEHADEFKEVLGTEDGAAKINEQTGVRFGKVNDESFSLIKTKCVINGVDVGSLAVVGPQRMDYLKIASALQYITKELEEGSAKGDGDGK